MGRNAVADDGGFLLPGSPTFAAYKLLPSRQPGLISNSSAFPTIAPLATRNGSATNSGGTTIVSATCWTNARHFFGSVSSGNAGTVSSSAATSAAEGGTYGAVAS